MKIRNRANATTSASEATTSDQLSDCKSYGGSGMFNFLPRNWHPKSGIANSTIPR